MSTTPEYSGFLSCIAFSVYEVSFARLVCRVVGLFTPLGLPLFHSLALVPFLVRLKPKIPFLGLSLLLNQTKMLATQAKRFVETRVAGERLTRAPACIAIGPILMRVSCSTG